jgi:hypothetical protein
MIAYLIIAILLGLGTVAALVLFATMRSSQISRREGRDD